MSRPGFGRNGTVSNVLGQNKIEEAVASQGLIMSLKQEAKYMTGARTVIKVNGQLVGFAFQVSWNIATEQTEIYTIDDPLPHEIAPKRISVSGTLGGLIIPGRSPTAELLQSDMLSFLVNKYITIEVRDSVTDEIIFKTNQAVVTSSQGSLTADQMGTMQLSWKAVGWTNEQFPETPVGIDKTSTEAQSPGNKTLDRLKKNLPKIPGF
jgi:hypothetical protein